MVVNATYQEHTNRLALGFEVLDAVSQRQVVYPLRADVEYGLPHQSPRPSKQFNFSQQAGHLPLAMTRHDSGRYSLVYQAGLRDHIDIRLFDYSRQYVPRRLRVPLLTLQTVLDIETNQEAEYVRGRGRKPVIFPGAGYDLMSKATGLRGRVLRDGEPMPWVWVEAYSALDDELVGRARGDERGEFLLLLNPMVAGAGDLSAIYSVTVRVFGPQIPLTPSPLDLPDVDALWDLPQEEIPAVGLPDAVSAGENLPDGYVEGASAVVPCQIGRVLTGVHTADFVFTVA